MSNLIGRRRFLADLSMSAIAFAIAPGISRAKQRGGLKISGAPKNIVILGGGLAGLAAGYELKQAGHNVTILEARKAPGGRVRTLYDFDGGLYAEAGPAGIPSNHEFTMGYAVDFGMQIRSAVGFGLDTIAHIRGNRFRVGGNGSADVPFSLRSSEREAGVFGLPSLYLAPYMREVGNPRRADWPSNTLKEIDQISLRQLLESLGASDGAIDIIEASQLGLLGFGLDSVSAMDGVVTEAVASAPAFYEIGGGMELLAYAFKKRVKRQFKKRHIVKRIAQTETSVTVTYENADGEQTISADRVICTLPFSILKDIEMTPAFSEDKQRAIRELKMTPITRTYLQFRSRVWEQDRLSGYGLSDLAIQNTYSPTLGQPSSRGLLASYTGGQRALDLGAMSESDRQSFVLRRMGNLFNGLDSQYESGTSVLWHEEQWARGGFAYFEPGQMANLLPIAQRPEGRIHFAGEHTSAWHGWMQGALESGNRAAEEVNEAESQESIAVRTAR